VAVLSTSREALKRSLVAEVLRRFGEVRLRVTGASMLPSLWPEDVVLIHRIPFREIAPGDVVLFLAQDRFFIHRVLAKSEKQLMTRGDALAAPDPPVGSDELLGRVVSIRRGGAVRPPSAPGLVGRLLSFGARPSTTFCNILLRFHAIRRRLRAVTRHPSAPYTGVPGAPLAGPCSLEEVCAS
jgi:signal peptidase I